MHGTTAIRVKATSADGMISWRLASFKWYVSSINFRFSVAVFKFSMWALTDVDWFIFLIVDANSLRAFPDSEQIFVLGS